MKKEINGGKCDQTAAERAGARPLCTLVISWMDEKIVILCGATSSAYLQMCYLNTEVAAEFSLVTDIFICLIFEVFHQVNATSHFMQVFCLSLCFAGLCTTWMKTRR